MAWSSGGRSFQTRGAVMDIGYGSVGQHEMGCGWGSREGETGG